MNAAALNLVRASNPQDQVCVVNFNNDYYLDQDYTGNVSLLRDALERIESRGGTALYDALVATSDHLMKSAKLQKKIILVVTDGEDTASRYDAGRRRFARSPWMEGQRSMPSDCWARSARRKPGGRCEFWRSRRAEWRSFPPT